MIGSRHGRIRGPASGLACVSIDSWPALPALHLWGLRSSARAHAFLDTAEYAAEDSDEYDPADDSHHGDEDELVMVDPEFDFSPCRAALALSVGAATSCAALRAIQEILAVRHTCVGPVFGRVARQLTRLVQIACARVVGTPQPTGHGAALLVARGTLARSALQPRAGAAAWITVILVVVCRTIRVRARAFLL